MALTDDQITAQNFKEFYGQIRPYLNGNSPVCVNQFNKSDLYSTDEKMIGCWIDGKPLYQKVISLDWNTMPSENIQIYIDNILQDDSPAEGIRLDGYYTIANDSNRLSINEPYIASDIIYYVSGQFKHGTGSSKNVIELLHNLHPAWYPAHLDIIVQYTKVNDTQVSITDVNDYSTDEHIIGHWIDGKPLYQRTVSWGAISNGTHTKDASSWNIDNLIEAIGFIKRSTGEILTIPNYYMLGNQGVNWLNYYGQNIAVLVQGFDNITDCCVTYKYTKTTD